MAPETATMHTERLLAASDVAKLLGMRVDYVYALCRGDGIPHLRFGRTLRFRPKAIEEWLASSERGQNLNGANSRPPSAHAR